MTTTVVYTRRRGGEGPGSGFEYFKATWDGMASAWKGKETERLQLAPRVQIDVTGLTDNEVDADEIAVREIVGRGVTVRLFRAPPDLNFAGNFVGTKHAYWGALELALEGTADDLLVLEDDLAFCGNGFLRMLTFPIPVDLDWISFFGPQIVTKARAWAGLWRVPAPSFGVLACKFTRAAVEKIVAWREESPQDWLMFNAGDQALDRCRQRNGMHWGLHVPELVQHMGELSTQGDEMSESRMAKTWPGPAFDALGLYSRHDLFT